MARLAVEGLCKGWEFPVIDALTFAVEEGEFFVIVGASGIGKTTLLRLIAGLETPDAGRVIVGGRDMTRIPPYRRNIAMTFESYALYPHLTVYENIASPLRARRLPHNQRDQRVRATAKLLKIDHLLERRPGEVSGGQKQRTALGRTLVADPEVFLLDEPISHLDAKIRHELRTQFHTLEDLRRVATVYVTHDYAEALSLGDRIGVMGKGGRLEQVGAPRELFERPANLTVAEHLGQPTINVVRVHVVAETDALFLQADQARLRLPVPEAARSLIENHRQDRLTLGLRPQHLQPVTADGPERLTLKAEVDIYEALGAMGIMLVQCEGIRLTAITDPEMTYHAGQEVTLALDLDRLFYFDAESGRNLAVQD